MSPYRSVESRHQALFHPQIACTLPFRSPRGRMDYLLLATRTTRALLSGCFRHGSRVTIAATVGDLLTALRSCEGECVLIDPMLVPDERLESVCSAAVERAARVLLLFPRLDEVACHRLVRAGVVGVSEVLLVDGSDDASMTAHRLRRMPASSAQGAVLRQVTMHLKRIPATLRVRLVQLFAGGPLPRSAIDLCNRNGLGLRTVQRCIGEAGFRGTQRIVDACRLTRWYDMMQLSERSPDWIAANVGYSSTRTLRAHCQVLVHSPPRTIRSQVDANDFAQRLTRAITKE